jgi:XTP/dITP diphosphohydrolase
VAEINRNWDAVKTAERPQRTGPFEGIPDALPALAKAQKFLVRAERSGLAVEPAETPEVETATTEEELGDLLLAVVGSARAKGFDAERALRGAIRRQFVAPS